MIPFKSISQLEKTVESCLITFSSQDCKLKIRLMCRYKITKTYTLPFIESDSLTVSLHSFMGNFLVELLNPPRKNKWVEANSATKLVSSLNKISGKL